jgi:rare lipoprotein A
MQQNGNGFKAGLAALAGVLALVALPSIAQAKRPGARHCFGGVCHRVMTIAETEAQIGKMHRLTASHYDDCHHDRFNPCGLTSSGEVYRANKPDNTASAVHPDGTVLLLRNPTNGLAAVVRVNNFGPFHGSRKLDVSRATAERLGFARRGVTSLQVMVVYAPTAAEARYERKRHYDPVPGYIGSADTFDTAYLRYADMTLHKRIARHDAVACRIAAKHPAPRLKLVASLEGETYTRLARY